MSKETVRGKAVIVHFDGGRSIHSRNCVLDRPNVFGHRPARFLQSGRRPIVLVRKHHSITRSARTRTYFSTLGSSAPCAKRGARYTFPDVPRQPNVPMGPGYFTSSSFPVSTS